MHFGVLERQRHVVGRVSCAIADAAHQRAGAGDVIGLVGRRGRGDVRSLRGALGDHPDFFIERGQRTARSGRNGIGLAGVSVNGWIRLRGIPKRTRDTRRARRRARLLRRRSVVHRMLAGRAATIQHRREPHVEHTQSAQNDFCESGHDDCPSINVASAAMTLPSTVAHAVNEIENSGRLSPVTCT